LHRGLANTAQEDLVEIMARAINQTDLFAERTEAARNALAALDRAGYVVVKKSAGIHHEREPYVTKEDL
jgi:hypothetical protein